MNDKEELIELVKELHRFITVIHDLLQSEQHDLAINLLRNFSKMRKKLDDTH